MEYTGCCPVSASSTLAARVSLSPLSPTQMFRHSFMIRRSRMTFPLASSCVRQATHGYNKHERMPAGTLPRELGLAARHLESMQEDCSPPCLLCTAHVGYVGVSNPHNLKDEALIEEQMDIPVWQIIIRIQSTEIKMSNIEAAPSRGCRLSPGQAGSWSFLPLSTAAVGEGRGGGGQ